MKTNWMGPAAAALMAAWALAGCVDRKETITVDAAGTVSIEATFDTQSQSELHEGDAVPSMAGGWIVEESTEIDDQGKTHHKLAALTILPPGVELPASYAAPRDLDAELYLQFPTTLLIEQRSDGTYYHFHRTYLARRWAPLGLLRRELVDEPLKKLEGKKPESLDPQQHRLILDSFVDFEIAKMTVFARRAFLDQFPQAPQDCWLAVRAAITGMKSRLDYDGLVRLMEAGDEAQRDEAVGQETARWEAQSRQGMEAAVRQACGLGSSAAADFMKRYDRHRRDFEITEDLGDDGFEINVVMPGSIVAGNADSVQGDRAAWKFGGERVRDADYELMVTSRLVEAR